MKMIQRILVSTAIATCLGLMPAAAFAQAQTTTPPTPTEQTHIAFRDSGYLRHAAETTLLGSKLGQIAAEKGTSAQVKDLGQKVAASDTKAYNDLSKIAQTKGVAIPTELSKHHARSIDELSKLSGADFDKEVLKRIVSTRETDVRVTQSESEKGKDMDLKNFASSNLPTLQGQLRDARALYAAEKKTVTEPAGTEKTKGY